MKILKKWRIISKKYIVFLCLFSIILVTGCGQQNIDKRGSSESEWKIGRGVLTHKLGIDPGLHDEDFIPVDTYFLLSEDIIEKTEHETPTGKWFFHKNRGKFGSGLSTGTKQAGEEYFVSLIGHKKDGEQLNREIQIQLTERDDQLERKDLIEDEIVYVKKITNEEKIYSSKLPDKENVTYLLSVEILDDAGNVEDTIVSIIYVPAQEINAELKMDKNIYKQSEQIATLILENFGPTFLNLGTYYTIEKKVEETWRIVPLDLNFNDIGIMLSPNRQYDQTIEIDQLTSGEYRIVKEFYADGIDLSATLAVEFIIE